MISDSGKDQKMLVSVPLAAMGKQERNKTESGQSVLIEMCLFLTLYHSRLQMHPVEFPTERWVFLIIASLIPSFMACVLLWDSCSIFSQHTPLAAVLMSTPTVLIWFYIQIYLGFPGDSVVKNPPAIQDTRVRSLSQEDSPGERNGNLLQYSCLGISWPEEPGGLQSVGS